MKSRLISLSLVTLMSLASFQAEAAKRLGGGQSVGKQSSNVTQREAVRPAQPTPPQQAATPAAQPSPAAQPAAAAAQAQRKPWGAMLGGLAAGLGLAWLASSLGLGEAFGQILMFGLLALLVMVAVGWFMRRRAQSQSGSYAFQGAGPGTPATAPQYNPQNVGNDASARPWEGQTHFEPAQPRRAGATIGSGLIGGSQNWSIPADFDVPGFEAAAKANFVSLQDAWDRSDIEALRAMMTDDMLHEIRQQLAERESLTNGQPNKTEVVMLEAQLLGIEDLGSGFMASIEFSGLIREDQSAGASPFREVWNMTRAKEGQHGWLVAGVQALQ